MVVELAKSDNVQAAVLLHPSFVSVDDIKGTIVFYQNHLLLDLAIAPGFCTSVLRMGHSI